MKIPFRVVYEDAPGAAVIEEAPENIIIVAEGYGFNLIRYYFRFRQPEVHVHLDRLKLSGARKATKKISSKQLLADFAMQFGSDLNVKQLLPDTLILKLNRKNIRNLPVELRSRLAYRKQHTLFDKVTIRPATVTISGADYVVDTLHRLFTDSLILEDLFQTTTSSITLDLPEGVSADPDVVLVSIPVEEYTEQLIDVKVRPVNLPDSLDVRIFPEQVQVSMIVPVSKFNRMISDEFDATVDMKEALGGKEKLRVDIIRSPDFGEVRKVEPSRIEYIFRKK